jgi:uncharacterized membrane protein YcaP (DUF421 family)
MKEITGLLGLNTDPHVLTFTQISLRSLIVLFASLIMLRIADRRFLAKLSAFDAILGFALASVLARAVNGSSAFFPTIGGCFVLVVVHRILAIIAFHWHAFSVLIKGKELILVQEGRINPRNLAKAKISSDDLLEEARTNGLVDSVADIRKATMERSGQVSVLPFKKD